MSFNNQRHSVFLTGVCYFFSHMKFILHCRKKSCYISTKIISTDQISALLFLYFNATTILTVQALNMHV